MFRRKHIETCLFDESMCMRYVRHFEKLIEIAARRCCNPTTFTFRALTIVYVFCCMYVYNIIVFVQI